jgi:TolB-like protein/DNA-binding winged helix-turn-helix (wHTH) protein/Flp pilus assembly protein TadD
MLVQGVLDSCQAKWGMEQQRHTSAVRFGIYEVDLRSGELRKAGIRIRVQQQPLRLLEILLEHPGEVVNREELRSRIWPDENFGDFDQAVNVAVAKLRGALGDSADNPRYIETLPRRGYRFIAPVESTTPDVPKAEPEIRAAAPKIPPPQSRRWWALAIAVAAVALLLMGSIYVKRRGASVIERQGRIMVAVLPFEDLSNDPNQEYFSDGLTEEMITELGRLNPEELGVIARLSAMQYKHANKGIAQIARELGVDYLVEGSVRRSDNRVRVAVQLIRAHDQAHVWADSYEREARDVLDLQRELCEDVAREVRIKLARSRGPAPQPVSPEAHEDYLKGRFFFSKRNNNENALRYFQQAIEKDPNYPLPYTGLADLYQLSDNPQLAREAVQKALDLDDQLAEAHNSLAGLLYRADRDWAGAEREFKRALELDPNYAPAHHWYSMYLALRGRPAEALAEARKASELDPLSPVVGANLAKKLQEAGQDDKAVAQAKKTLDLDPGSAVTHAVLGIIYQDKRMYPEAITEYQTALQLGGPPGEMRGLLGYAYAASGNRVAAEKVIGELKLLWPAHAHAALDLAEVFSGLGDKEKALYWLGKAEERHVTDLVEIGQDPGFAGLRNDPDFQALVKRAGGPE